MATNVYSGKPYVFAPFRSIALGTMTDHQVEEFADDAQFTGPDEVGLRISDTGVFDAAIASAAFPYVTPSIAVSSWRDDGSAIGDDGRFEFLGASRTLADGGYVDGSGAGVARIVLTSMQRHNPNLMPYADIPVDIPPGAELARRLADCDALFFTILQAVAPTDDLFGGYPLLDDAESDVFLAEDCVVPIRPYVISIRTDPILPPVTGQNFFLDPVRALTRARSARSEIERLALWDQLCQADWDCLSYAGTADRRWLESSIMLQLVSLPLGWNLSAEQVREMDAVVAPDPDVEIDIEAFYEGFGLFDWIDEEDRPFGRMNENPTSVAAIIKALENAVEP